MINDFPHKEFLSQSEIKVWLDGFWGCIGSWKLGKVLINYQYFHIQMMTRSSKKFSITYSPTSSPSFSIQFKFIFPSTPPHDLSLLMISGRIFYNFINIPPYTSPLPKHFHFHPCLFNLFLSFFPAYLWTREKSDRDLIQLNRSIMGTLPMTLSRWLPKKISI